MPACLGWRFNTNGHRVRGVVFVRRRWSVSRARSGNVRQPDRVLAESIVGHKAERRPGTREEWLAVTKHEGAEVESVLIDKTKVGQAARQVWSTSPKTSFAMLQNSTQGRDNFRRRS
jgi:uncharacterized protein YecE (DUF72 family)